jgi:hypothetical protein
MLAWGLLAVVGLSTASAQTAQPAGSSGGPRIDVSAAYQVLHIPDETFPFGLNFDVSTAVRPSIDLVGEFGFARDDQNEPGITGSVRFFNIGGGPRWIRRIGSYAPFAQLIVGAVRPSADLVVNGVPRSDVDWAFMLQPGAGVAVPMAHAFSLVGQVDYRRAFFQEQGENELRFLIGVRVGVR